MKQQSQPVQHLVIPHSFFQELCASYGVTTTLTKPRKGKPQTFEVIRQAKATPVVFQKSGKGQTMVGAREAFKEVFVIKIYTYSEKSFVVCGDTKPIKDFLLALGGTYNPNLKQNVGKAWIFGNKRLKDVEKFFNAHLLRVGNTYVWNRIGRSTFKR